MHEIPLLGIKFSNVSVPPHELTLARDEDVSIGEVEFGRNGHVEAMNDEVLVSLTYESLQANEAPDGQLLGFDMSLFRRIRSFGLRAKNGQVINLYDMPEGWSSFFSIDPSKTSQRSVARPDSRTTIVTDKPILTPAGILTHLHEAGHAWTTDFDEEMESRSALFNRSRSLKPNERDLILTHEANAWAYAFNKLDPVVGDRAKTFYVADLVRYAYDDCLASYERIIEELYHTGGS
jgi:hypothetical protein